MGKASTLDQFEDYQGGQKIIKLFQGANQCISYLVREHGIESETKHFFDRVFDDKWIMIVENGSKE
jgi:hypothetical protein